MVSIDEKRYPGRKRPPQSAYEQRYAKGRRTKFLGIRGYVIRPMWLALKSALRATFGSQPDVFYTDKRGPNTLLYPKEKLQLPDLYRGKNEVVWQCCIGCELCARICPNQCIEMEVFEADRVSDMPEELLGPNRSTQDEKKNQIKRPGIDFGRCMFCGNCEEYCPTGAMRMTDEFELANSSRDALVFEAELLRVEPYTLEGEVKLQNKIREIPLVDSDNCTGCQLCMRNCPTRCIEMVDGPKLRKDKPIKNPKVDTSKCVGCATCMSNCKFNALKMEAV
ncbi:MAG: 4Fe-4S binding protein [Thermoplasmata archaeon]|nr:MAG: 4Fe-4S binding protein [Thermoplasmata archaeon]